MNCCDGKRRDGTPPTNEFERERPVTEDSKGEEGVPLPTDIFLGAMNKPVFGR